MIPFRFYVVNSEIGDEWLVAGGWWLMDARRGRKTANWSEPLILADVSYKSFCEKSIDT
jgi:hypothetical protein